MHSNKLLESLQEIVGKEFVTTDRFATFAYTRDTSTFGGTEAETVVRPGSTEEVSRIMSLAYQHRIPVVVRGGGSSIYGQPKGIPGCRCATKPSTSGLDTRRNPGRSPS